MRSPSAMYDRVCVHRLAAGSLDEMRPFCPETVVYQPVDATVWHVTDTCPLLRTPFLHVRCSFENLPLDHQLCRSCGSWRQLPLGRVLLVLDELCDVADSPLDWRGVSRRRRALLEPFLSFPVRTAVPALFWPAFRAALEPLLDDLATESAAAALVLDRKELFEAALSHRLVASDEYANSPVSLWLNSMSAASAGFRAVHDVTGAVRSLCAAPQVPTLLVAKDLPLFAHGEPVPKLVDLLALTAERLSPDAVLLDLPPAVVAVFRECRALEVLVLDDPSPDRDVLRWAVRLFRAAPHRSLAAAHAAAVRLAEARVPV